MAQQTEQNPAELGSRWFNDLVRERLGERRFYALADEVRAHEAAAREQAGELSERDRELYAQLRLICGEL